MRKKMAVLGNRTAALPFLQLGVPVFEAPLDPVACQCQAADLIRQGYALLLVTEDCLVRCPQLLTRYDQDPAVTVLLLPGQNAAAPGLAQRRMTEMMEKALGQSLEDAASHEL
ncbi:MAG: V-type ATP synthase subunit F [Oscillospiraceae bacterium]|nr:V-type ATP synthase subunit F [Oscillospiraceae bacterium]MDD4368958.1 V-type ATP synthase subunit F [Oscillospiraceae bacterium]